MRRLLIDLTATHYLQYNLIAKNHSQEMEHYALSDFISSFNN